MTIILTTSKKCVVDVVSGGGGDANLYRVQTLPSTQSTRSFLAADSVPGETPKLGSSSPGDTSAVLDRFFPLHRSSNLTGLPGGISSLGLRVKLSVGCSGHGERGQEGARKNIHACAGI